MALLWHKESGTWKDRTDALSFKSNGAWGKKPTYYKHEGQWELLRKTPDAPFTPFGIYMATVSGGASTWDYTDTDGQPLEAKPNLNLCPVYKHMKPVVVDDQHMIRVLPFYLKFIYPDTGPASGKLVTLFSDHMEDGYHLHPAFYDGKGNTVKSILFGQYKASLSDDNKLCSIPGVLPYRNGSTDAIALELLSCAESRNIDGITGFSIQNFYQRAALQWLCLIDAGTTDVQPLYGIGHVNASSPVTVDNEKNSLWRGFYGLWGNVWECLYGMVADTASNNKLSILSNSGDGSYVPVTVGNWKKGGATGYRYPKARLETYGEGYDFRDIFYPAGDYSASTTTYSNGAFASAWQVSGTTQIPVSGGGCQNGSTSGGSMTSPAVGLFCHASYIGGTWVGTRLIKYEY